MRRLLIGTPAHDGRNECYFTHAYGETIRLGMLSGVDVRGLFLSYDSIVQKARNDLVKAALDFDFDDLVFIDSDEHWEPAWVMRLLKHPVDCVGFPVRKKEDEESYNVRADGPHIPVDGPLALMVVRGLGTGFLRLTRKAMQALWDRSVDYVDDSGKKNRWMFDIGPVQGRLVGEDIGIAAKLGDAGIPIYLDPVHTISHIGAKKWDGDFLAYIKQRQLAEPKSFLKYPMPVEDEVKEPIEVAMGG